MLSKDFYEHQKLNELAFERGALINRCVDLGRRFVEHFDKIYNDTNEKTIKHHAMEMQAWLNDAVSSKLKSTKKNISFGNLYDWFFTCGKFTSDLFDNKTEVSVYDDFIEYLKSHNMNVLESLKDLGLYYGE